MMIWNLSIYLPDQWRPHAVTLTGRTCVHHPDTFIWHWMADNGWQETGSCASNFFSLCAPLCRTIIFLNVLTPSNLCVHANILFSVADGVIYWVTWVLTTNNTCWNTKRTQKMFQPHWLLTKQYAVPPLQKKFRPLNKPRQLNVRERNQHTELCAPQGGIPLAPSIHVSIVMWKFTCLTNVRNGQWISQITAMTEFVKNVA
jgi:hypothetical protein